MEFGAPSLSVTRDSSAFPCTAAVPATNLERASSAQSGDAAPEAGRSDPYPVPSTASVKHVQGPVARPKVHARVPEKKVFHAPSRKKLKKKKVVPRIAVNPSRLRLPC